MDNLTHTLTGALLGQAGLKRKTGLAMPALIIGANLPDVDAACFFWLDGVEHLGFRRGISHGPIAWVLLPLMLAGLLYGFDRWQIKRGKRPDSRLPVRFGWLYALSFIGCLSHPALDWLNSYGIRFLEPFSSQWFYGDTLFIIDVWLWLGMGFATWLSLRREKLGKSWRWPAVSAIIISIFYVGGNMLTSSIAQSQGESGNFYPAEAIANPVPFYPWRREIVAVDYKGIWHNWPWSLFGPHYAKAIVTSEGQCIFPDIGEGIGNRSDVEAFLIWSRAPFAERASDGSVLLRDARFYDPRARDNFTVTLPDVKCEPIR